MPCGFILYGLNAKTQCLFWRLVRFHVLKSMWNSTDPNNINRLVSLFGVKSTNAMVTTLVQVNSVRGTLHLGCEGELPSCR